MGDETAELLGGIEREWERLTIANDFVFGKVMLDEGLCAEVLEAILGVPVERVEYVGREEVLDASPEGRGVRLDVYVRDGAGTVYNVEMQTTNTRELPRRSRYYQAMMTFDQIGRGEPYRSLRDAYVIFICGFDLFGRGRRVYSFENRCVGDEGLALGDGAHILFLSASSPTQPGEGPRLNELLDYVASGEVTGELSSKLDAAVERVLDNRSWRLEYMMLAVRDQLNIDKGVEMGRKIGLELGLEQGKAEGLAAGRAEGIEQGKAEGLAAGRAEGLEQGKAEGLAAGRAEGLEQGKAEGLAAGRAEGERRLSALVSQLVAEGRVEDVARATSDAEALGRLYEEFGMA